MKVLVACEFSGVVRDAFVAQGHDAWSCDLLPTENNPYAPFSRHYQCDVRQVLDPNWEWDLVIAHPPCTYISNMSNCRINEPGRATLRKQGMEFFEFFTKLHHIPKVAIENPRGLPERQYRKPDQIIQPWQFGHKASKATCLWLKNLPILVGTKVEIPEKRWDGRRFRGFVDQTSNWDGSAAKRRSITFAGVAKAMAEQWGGIA